MKTLVQHFIFERDSTWCTHCGSEISRRRRQTVRGGFTVPPRRRRSVRVESPVTPMRVYNARGLTVMYHLDEQANTVERSVAICWHGDFFSKKRGTIVCAERVMGGATDVLPLYNRRFILRECHELFREYPIYIEDEIV